MFDDYLFSDAPPPLPPAPPFPESDSLPPCYDFACRALLWQRVCGVLVKTRSKQPRLLSPVCVNAWLRPGKRKEEALSFSLRSRFQIGNTLIISGEWVSKMLNYAFLSCFCFSLGLSGTSSWRMCIV